MPATTLETFAATLRKAMEVRGVLSKDLAAQIGVAPTTMSDWRHGVKVPLLRNSAPLAEALDWPSLATMVRDLRTSTCPVCGTLRVHGSNAGVYCGRRCQNTMVGRRRANVKGKASVLAQQRLKIHVAVIDELCRKWCEPETGLCRDPQCPPQKYGLSPLPVLRKREVA